LSHTSGGIQNVLTKAKRKFEIIHINDNRTENAYAELFCIKCNKSLGKCELHYSSHECFKYCSDCLKEFIKPVPNKLSDEMNILEDYGGSVILRYENIRHEEFKQCYFSSMGRYINIKGKRHYI
jgi:hypothetical protein